MLENRMVASAPDCRVYFRWQTLAADIVENAESGLLVVIYSSNDACRFRFRSVDYLS